MTATRSGGSRPIERLGRGAERKRAPGQGSRLRAHGVARLIAERLRARLEEIEASYARHGRSLRELGSADDLARRMTAALPEPSVWDDALGPFYGTRKVAELLGGISRQAVSERRGRRTLLGLKTADGVWVYPAFQFDEHNSVREGLSAVMKTLAASGIDDWTLAGWLVSPLESLDGRSVVGWLEAGGDPERALAAAEDAAHRLSR